ncbi:MAG: NAD kinase [Candidatus Protistobacter heckmanni]|nr:NAD kinase [Candidatus Protistobacter heckmanni]
MSSPLSVSLSATALATSTAVGSSPFEPFGSVALVGKPQANGIAELLGKLAAEIAATGRKVVFEAGTAVALEIQGYPIAPPETLGSQVEVAVVLGGDGTMLGIGRHLAPAGVPLIGVNLGRLGFMTDISLAEMPTVLGAMLDGNYERENRSLLQGCVLRDGAQIFSATALNDVVVNRTSPGGMVELMVTVDGRFMYYQRSDGLIMATPTGSTAYALAAGGPILHPEVGGIVLVPVAPHALSNRPIVLLQDVEVVIELGGERDACVNFDMQSLASLIPGDRVIVRRSPHTATFLHPQGTSYFATLRKKLHWHEYPSA